MSQVSTHRLAAIDALARGFTNLRANAELVIVQLIATLFIGASIAVPVFLFLRKVGIDPSIFMSNDPARVQAAIEGIDFDPTSLLGALGGALLFTLVGGTILFLFYCWAQGGTLAVLSRGDAQAPVVRSAPVEVFRTFAWRAFFSWSFRYGWRLFWLYNLYLVLVSLVALLLLVPFAFVGGSIDESNVGATCLLACGLMIPVFAILFLMSIAVQVSAAVLVVEDLGVGRAFRRGLSLTGRRIGGLLLLVLLLVTASMAVGTIFFMLEFGLGLAMREASALRFAITAGAEILKYMLSSALGLIFGAALIALVRGESRLDAAPFGPTRLDAAPSGPPGA
jgi:hypothetical protein